MDMTRRLFVGSLGGCAAHVLWMSAGGGAASRLWAAQPLGKVVQTEPWGRLEEVGPGMWAMVSTPLAGPRGSDAWRTVCNGGIIAGRDEVLLIEAFATPGGAAWLPDLVNGDAFSGSSSSLAAVAGYPDITVPMGFVFGLPVGVSFFGRPWSEPTLLKFAYSFEQTTRARRPPQFLRTADLAVH